MEEFSEYKTVYVTVKPEELQKQRDPVRKYVRRALSAGDDPLGLGSSRGLPKHDVGEARIKRAVKKSLSCDIQLSEDSLVPWQTVVDKEQADELLKNKKKSQRLARRSTLPANIKSVKKEKSLKKGEASKQLKIAFFKLLNVIEPEKGYDKSNFDAHEVCKMLDKLPVLAKDKFRFTAIPEPIMALHMLCAIDAPLQCIKKCYKLNPDAVHNTSSTLGSPLHYACFYNASVESVRYIATKDTPAVLQLNRAKRTALHLACMREADPDLVILLTEAAPDAAELQDSHGQTALHFAVGCEHPDFEIIEDLTEVYPHACVLHDDLTGATPLHAALANPKCDADIIMDLVAANAKALKAVDKEGCTPLHVAAQNKADVKTIKALTKKHSKILSIKNNDKQTAYKIAKSMGQGKDILKLLKPHRN